MIDLFEQNGLEVIDFDAPNPSRPHHSGVEVANWLRQRGVYGTLLVKAKKVVKVLRTLVAKKAVMSRACPSCEGSKLYIGAKYTRDCITCRVDGVSLGHMTDASERRLTAFKEAKVSGQKMRANNHGNSWTFAS